MNKHQTLIGWVFGVLVLLGGAACQQALPGTSGGGPGGVGKVSRDTAYNVRDFGAVGNGKTLDNKAIDRAIAAANQAGGGTVVVPPGTYLCGSIHLKSNVRIYLEAGSEILGAPQEMNAYDPAEPFHGKAYQDGGHTYYHNSLIWGEDLENIAITGMGMINGGGLVREDKDVGQGPIGKGDKAIALRRCKNVLLRDFTIFHGGHFAVIVLGCDRVTMDNLTIDTNRDGIDLDCVTNTVVSNCRINSPTDDGICPKSSLGLGVPKVTENLTIVNCQVSGFKEGTLLDGRMIPNPGARVGRIKLGTESNGGFRNVTISNCTFRHCRGLALQQVDGGVLENITISNIAMNDLEHYALYIRLGNRNRGPEGTKTGTVKNILISNIIATGVDAMSGMHISGIPGHPVEGVRVENFRLISEGGGTRKDAERVVPEAEKGYPEPHLLGRLPGYGIFLRHAKDIEMANVRVGFEKDDRRPAIWCQDVAGLEMDNFKAQTVPGVPAAKLTDVTGLVVRNSPALEKASGAE